MATVQLTHVKKVYTGKVTAVYDFNLSIKDKEFVVFVGPSGCGKSTTLRMVAGLEDITDGIVQIDGKIVNDLQPKDRFVSMVFQNYALYPHLTVFDNIAFPLRLMKQVVKVPLTDKEKESHKVKIASFDKSIAILNKKIVDEKVAAKRQEALAYIDEQKRPLSKKLTEETDPKAKAKLEKKLEDLEYDRLKAVYPIDAERRLKAITDERTALAAELASGEKVERRKMSNDQIFEKVTAVAKTLGITDYLTRKPRALSGGQRQRVAIGRAMVKDCKVLLMDEPLSNLDAKLRNQMRAEIILLRKKIDTTFIYVTHDQTEAMTLGDRIVVMKDGLIMQVGTPQQVFDFPENLFVAEFIGAPKMNTLKCSLVKEGAKYYVNPFGAKIEVTGEKALTLAKRKVETREIILGVRPEHIEIVQEAAPNAIHTTLQVNEMMGSEFHLHLITDDGTPLIVRTPTIQLSDKQKGELVYGKSVYLTFGGQAMHFFDAKSTFSLLVDQPENLMKKPV